MLNGLRPSITVLAAACIFGHHAEATTPSGKGEVWTLPKLVQVALANNAELKFYEAEVLAAQGKRTQAGLWKNPELSGQYGERKVKEPGAGQETGFTRSGSITQTFEFPGKGSLRKGIADRDIEIAQLGLKQFRLALSGQVQNLAYQLALAASNAEAAEEIVARSTKVINVLRERPTAGGQQLLELRLIEANVAEFQKYLREFQQTQEEARIELNRLVGQPPSQRLPIKIQLTAPIQRLNLTELVQKGSRHNLQLRTRKIELEKAVREVSAAKLEIAPDLSIGPFFSQDKAGADEQNYGVTLSATLPLWNWNQGNIVAAKARREQADAMLMDARQRVESEIARRVRLYQLTQQHLEKIPAEMERNLREAAAEAENLYRHGSIPVQLYLQVQREFLNLRQMRNQLVLDAKRYQWDLSLLTGDPLDENLALPLKR
ncbi:MAG: TolC family protein [Candidatus Methylacidiphilales bacterium]